MVSEEKDFFMFSNISPVCKTCDPGAGSFLAQGHNLSYINLDLYVLGDDALIR